MEIMERFKCISQLIWYDPWYYLSEIEFHSYLERVSSGRFSPGVIKCGNTLKQS